MNGNVWIRGGNMKACFMTDVGKVRSNNEDSGGIFRNKSKQVLAVVADGMGGHAGGEIASQLATQIVQDKWEKTEGFQTAANIEQWISETVSEANQIVYKESKEKADLEGMGTTLVLAACMEEFITVAHIGDSRCYLSNEGGLKQLTEDHSLVNELLRAGQISPDDAAYHPRKNVVSRALGTDKAVKTDIQTIGWEYGDKILLCSDGLTDKVHADELAEFLGKDEAISEIGEQLVDLANGRGGEDNISLAIVHYDWTARAGENE